MRRLGTFVVLAVVSAVAACSDDVTAPGKTIELEIVSPVDTVMARGAVIALNAVATANGSPVTVDLIWESADPNIATVTQGGVVAGANVGRTVITVRTGTYWTSMPLRVVNADLAAVAAVLGDPLRGHLVTPLTAGVRSNVQDALLGADAARTSGHILALRDHLTTVGSQAAAATGADDRVMLATLRLLTDHAVRQLGLGTN